MNTQDYNQIQSLRKQLHESKKSNNINENSNNSIKELNEQLVQSGCGTQQINE